MMLDDRPSAAFCGAATLMGFGLWRHMTGVHEHPHRHEFLEYDHSHCRIHQPVEHAHRRYPDIHRDHEHP